MKTNYDELWNLMIGYLETGKGSAAKKIWDSVSEDAWKYNDLQD